MKKFAVIVAGGSGQRMGTSIPKQFLPLQGRPVIWHTLTAFLDAFDDLEIILVLPEDHISIGQEIIHTTRSPQRTRTTTGGDSRFQSVKNGLQYIQHPSIVFIHDGVRCLLTPGLVRRCYAAAMEKGNAVPAIPAVDSLRMVTPEGNAITDRNKIRIIQTPQTFHSDVIKAAFEQDYDPSFTDEASVVERLGVKIHLVDGETTNIKITQPFDLLMAEKVLELNRQQLTHSGPGNHS